MRMIKIEPRVGMKMQTGIQVEKDGKQNKTTPRIIKLSSEAMRMIKIEPRVGMKMQRDIQVEKDGKQNKTTPRIVKLSSEAMRMIEIEPRVGTKMQRDIQVEKDGKQNKTTPRIVKVASEAMRMIKIEPRVGMKIQRGIQVEKDGKQNNTTPRIVKDASEAMRMIKIEPRVGMKIQSGIKVDEDGKQNKTLDLDSCRLGVRKILTYSNATPINYHSGAGFRCCFCPQQFIKPVDLKQHNLELHIKDINYFMQRKTLSGFFVKLDITNLQCNFCELDCANIELLIEHLNKVHSKNILADVKKLIFPFKFEKEELRCCNCSKLFNTFKMLQEHMHNHYRNFVCDVCSAGYVTKNVLRIHKASHDARSFKCSHCAKAFSTLAKKKIHEEYVHKTSSVFKSVCRICNERFKYHRQKERHMLKVHGVGTLEYKCQSCDKIYKSAGNLEEHVQNYHLMMRPHKCEVCDMGFYSSSTLAKHMRKHTGLKEFQCDICLKKYGRKYTLTEHMRIHTNDRRHKCEMCGEAFVQKCSLKGHMRSKHGVI